MVLVFTTGWRKLLAGAQTNSSLQKQSKLNALTGLGKWP
jgi:hypothetical protein